METLWNNDDELRDDFSAPDEENDWDTSNDENDDDYVRSNDDDEEDLIPIADDDDDVSGETDDDNDDDDQLDPLADRPTTFEADGDFTPDLHGRTTGTMIDHEPGLPGPIGGRQ